MTIEKFFLKKSNLKERSKADYQAVFDALAARFPGEDIDDISEEHLTEFVLHTSCMQRKKWGRIKLVTPPHNDRGGHGVWQDLNARDCMGIAMAALGDRAADIARRFEGGEISVMEARREVALLTGEKNPVVRVKQIEETLPITVPVTMVCAEFMDGTRHVELEGRDQSRERAEATLGEHVQTLLRQVVEGEKGLY